MILTKSMEGGHGESKYLFMSGVELEEGRQAGIGGSGAAWENQQHHILCSPYLIESTYWGTRATQLGRKKS